MEYFKSERIADGCYMISNSFTPSTPALCYLVEGDDCALLIDTIMGFGDLKAYCASLTDKPVRVINTHAHFDHFGGNFHFDSCMLHHKDIAFFMGQLGYTGKQIADIARQQALPEYTDQISDDDFADVSPIKVYPVYGGDVFDLGGVTLEVIEAGGHTAGSIVLLDRKHRILFAGDACNGNTLLEFDNSLSIAEYMETLLRLKKYQSEFDMMYCGHEVFDSSIIDEAIETVARVLAGTDAKCERPGMTGGTVLYAAEKIKDGYERVDGKRFNMSYVPDKLTVPTREKAPITFDIMKQM